MNSPVEIYISLGSNIDPSRNIARARDTCFNWLDNGRISSVYRSPPVGMNGADFLNAVVGGSTTEPLQSVIDKLLAIELAQGRVRTCNKFSDRTIDLDLLIYGNYVCNPVCNPESTKSISILPHPEIVQQAYVLKPLADVAGEYIHPESGRSIDELCASLKSQAPDMFNALTPVTL